MKPERIKELIKIALKSVEDIEDKDLRERTYEIVLNNLILKEDEHVKLPPREVEVRPEEDVKNKHKGQNPFLQLAKKFKVSEEEIEDYFEINDEKIEILYTIPMKSAIEIQLFFTLILLTLRKICFNEREVDASELRKSAKLKGVKSLVNLSTNLKRYPQFIIYRQAKIGGPGLYKLTTDGMNKGIEIVGDILNKKTTRQDFCP